MRSIVFPVLIAVSFLIAPEAHAQSDSLLKTNDIRILLNLMDVGPAMQRSLIDEIATGRANQEADLPANFWDEFEKEAMNSLPAFIERMIPTYDEQFSHDDIKALIEIYSNPAMKKMNAAEPALTAAAAKAGEAWGQEIGLRVAMKMDSGSSETPASSTPAQETKAAKKKRK